MHYPETTPRDDNEQPEALAIPETLETVVGQHGTYRIIDELGEGDQGKVRLAVTESGEHVAVKDLFINNNEQFAAATRHQKMLQSVPTEINGVPLPTYIDHALTDKHPIRLVQKFIPGKNLTEILDERTISRTEAVEIIQKVARAIDTLNQEHGIYHRDIKPSNLKYDGEVVGIVDFGISRENNGTLTVAQGDTSYTSPEQFFAKEVSGRTEAYALAATLATLVTGNEPEISYTGTHHFTVAGLDNQTDEQGKLLVDIITRGTNPVLEKQFASAGELAEALEQWQRGEYIPGGHEEGSFEGFLYKKGLDVERFEETHSMRKKYSVKLAYSWEKFVTSIRGRFVGGSPEVEETRDNELVLEKRPVPPMKVTPISTVVSRSIQGLAVGISTATLYAAAITNGIPEMAELMTTGVFQQYAGVATAALAGAPIVHKSLEWLANYDGHHKGKEFFTGMPLAMTTAIVTENTFSELPAVVGIGTQLAASLSTYMVAAGIVSRTKGNLKVKGYEMSTVPQAPSFAKTTFQSMGAGVISAIAIEGAKVLHTLYELNEKVITVREAQEILHSWDYTPLALIPAAIPIARRAIDNIRRYETSDDRRMMDIFVSVLGAGGAAAAALIGAHELLGVSIPIEPIIGAATLTSVTAYGELKKKHGEEREVIPFREQYRELRDRMRAIDNIDRQLADTRLRESLQLWEHDEVTRYLDQSKHGGWYLERGLQDASFHNKACAVMDALQAMNVDYTEIFQENDGPAATVLALEKALREEIPIYSIIRHNSKSE